MKSQRTKFWYTKKCYLDYFNDMIAKADFPKYTWTFEIKTEGISNDTCMGHIIIDATSSFESDNKSVVLINMPDYKMYYKNGELVNVPDEGENTFPLFRAA